MKKIEDFSQIAFVMSDMVKRLLSGEDIPRKKVTVNVHIWEPVLEVLETVAEQMEIEKEEVIRELVQDALNDRLQNGVQTSKEEITTESKEEDEEMHNVAKSVGLDISGLTKGLTDLQNLATQLQGMQNMFGGINANQPINANGVKKNSK